jgi:site-specific DNA-methyltransferase (adenine-specific)
MSLEKHFTFKNILIWEKNNTSMGDLNGDFAPKYEMIIFLHKGRRDIIGSRDSNIIKCAKTGNDLHPTQKPVELCAYLLSKFSKENDTVLDPFMGSGTTGVACKKLNRNFIGIELDADYFKIASDRIAKPVEVPLF